MEPSMAARTSRTKASRYSPPERVRELRPSFLTWTSEAEMLHAPAQFWAAGDADLLNSWQQRVSVIGSRKAGDRALGDAGAISAELASRGLIVVSGLAKGIDRAAHTAAMASGGRTIAVIGTPIDKCYPAEHKRLQEEIYRDHLLVSQFPSGRRTYPSDFVTRNKFMALISHATVVVEAGDSSGTLSQASETQRLGRKLFIAKGVLRNKSLAWPEKFLNPKSGEPAIVLEDIDQLLDHLK